VPGIVVFVVSLGALFRDEVWPEWLNLALGAWLFIAPWGLGLATAYRTAAWDHWIVRAVIALLGLWNVFTTAGAAKPEAHAEPSAASCGAAITLPRARFHVQRRRT
jgi:hypothetical protein